MNYQFKGTPGPWKAEQATNDVTGTGCHMMNIRQQTKEFTPQIASVTGFWYHGSGSTEQEAVATARANAALITSAPAMFDALRAAEDILSFHEGSAKPESRGAEPTIRINGKQLPLP